MACAFKIKFWETFSTPRCYDILTDNQYKMPNSNDGCMRLRAPTACPKWNEGTDEDEHTGLTFECVSDIIKPFAKWQLEIAINGITWNEAAKHAATRQVMQPPPHPAKIVEPNTASSSSAFEQYTLLTRLVNVEKRSKQSDDAMVVSEPAKTVADSNKHPDDVDVIDSELIY